MRVYTPDGHRLAWINDYGLEIEVVVAEDL